MDKRILTINAATDSKIQDYLNNKNKHLFIYASIPNIIISPEFAQHLNSKGFDNIYFSSLSEGLFFVERLLGADIHISGSGPANCFNSWCEPCIKSEEDIYELSSDIDNNKCWMDYKSEVIKQIQDETSLPLAFPGFSLLDAACNLCGTDNFMVLMYENPAAAEYLLDTITQAQLNVYEQLQNLGLKFKNAYGFPAIYCNDLQMPYISPHMINDMLLPRYFKAAETVGGMMLGVHSADEKLVESIVKHDNIIGCGFDKRLSLDFIGSILGSKLFIINNYVYNPDLQWPQEVNGLWCNPIVQGYSEELVSVYKKLRDTCSFLVTIERYTLEDVELTYQELLL